MKKIRTRNSGSDYVIISSVMCDKNIPNRVLAFLAESSLLVSLCKQMRVVTSQTHMFLVRCVSRANKLIV
uniref:AlNc14C521G12031 protein n=1 Tax=Albugo laibachii Nc14 TaxID=890382 RepID=F0X0T7_9STRA|nr:AlNc14C521G12031 [Albugo laibachii Nc14]|eukprot:CCA27381.1 AlNc14C521G12031 [Albugo laibachii Nc14]